MSDGKLDRLCVIVSAWADRVGTVPPGADWAWRTHLFRLVRRGITLVPGFGIVRLSWIYIADLVEALVLAAQRGQRLSPVQNSSREDQGLYYVALDEKPTLIDVIHLAAKVQGCRTPRTINVPTCLVRLGASFNDFRGRILGRAYLLNLDKIREALAGSWLCSPDKIKRDLGFTCRTDLASGFRLTSQWYRDQGWL